MIEPSLELQRAVRALLVAAPAVTDLVATSAIVDGPRRPETFPSIIFGAAQTVAEDLTYARANARVFLDLHIWTKENEHVEAKQITGAIRTALSETPSVEGIDLVDFRLQGARFLRDPSQLYGHAVVSVEALVGWRT